MKTPVAVFAFRRPQHLHRCLTALGQCARLEECEVTIFCDGPRVESDRADVEATREVARAWAKDRGAQMVERDKNLGLARSIVSEVTALCAASGRAIVIEDDLEVAPDFLRYMLGALERFGHEPSVLQVSGHRLPFDWPSEASTAFLPCTTTWGWGTWQRAWERFQWQPQNLAALDDPTVAAAFDLGGSYPYTHMLRQRLAGENDSWGILWWWAVFQARGLVLYPRESLVQVGGFDGTGTHCRTEAEFLDAQRPGAFVGGDDPFPSRLEADPRALAALQRWLRAKTQPPWWKRPWRTLLPA